MKPHLTNLFLTEAVKTIGAVHGVDTSRADFTPADGFCGEGWW